MLIYLWYYFFQLLIYNIFYRAYTFVSTINYLVLFFLFVVLYQYKTCLHTEIGVLLSESHLSENENDKTIHHLHPWFCSSSELIRSLKRNVTIGFFTLSISSCVPFCIISYCTFYVTGFCSVGFSKAFSWASFSLQIYCQNFFIR